MTPFKDAIHLRSLDDLEREIEERVDLTHLTMFRFYFLALFTEVVILQKIIGLIKLENANTFTVYTS